MKTLNQYLTPRIKRYGIVLGTAVILMALIFSTSKRQNVDITRTPEQAITSVDFTGMPPKELTLNRISADLERLHQQQKAMYEEHQQEMERLQQEIRLLHQQEQPVQHTIPVPEPSASEPGPDVLQWNKYSQSPAINDKEADDYDAPPQPPRAIRVLGATYPQAISLSSQPEDKPKLLRLPAGSLLSGQLITGLDVPTGQGARREPYPVLIRIKASAILPNRYRTNVRECFVLASGYGDLSSERAYLRSETLSCIFQHHHKEQVIERPLEGYITGEDGKAGLRGRLVSKQGQVMAKAAMAGFLSGVSEAFDIKPVPVFSVVPNQNGQIQSPFQSGLKGSEALQSSLIKGSNKALEKLGNLRISP
ncbi:TrbI/VirB10 family protein [Endozoicomonas arenosclerae]|uniref:TrbI/VirB10 family protein n=1 Tax=Endozoicomonas arenosclerae TaxID=1633495 RepID=UPI000780BA7B|nr:TrbI/VirB10 family protein [Endozoicomonas arenosclerae]